MTSQLSDDDEGHEEDMYLFIYFDSYIRPVYIGCAFYQCNKNFTCQKKKVFISSFSLRCSCQDGTFLPNGRSSNVILQAGHQPAVLVWDCMTLAFISELKCHQYGVVCIAFSPDG